MNDVVGVHGIWQQQRGRRQLLAAWRPAMADGLERALGRSAAEPSLDIVFYGDLFLPGIRNDTKSVAPDHDMLADLTDDEVADLAAAADQLLTSNDVAAVTEPKGYTRVPQPLPRLLAALDRRFGFAAGVLYLGEVRQVRRYLCSPEVKDVVDSRVAHTMAGGPRILIGHSLGSVVAFEYVRQHPEQSLDLLLTLGSPLALRMIRSHMPDPAYGAANGKPPNVATWVNIRDPRDPVACAGGLEPWWAAVEDHEVDNQSDAHSVERYLGKKATGEALLRAVPALGTP